MSNTIENLSASIKEFFRAASHVKSSANELVNDKENHDALKDLNVVGDIDLKVFARVLENRVAEVNESLNRLRVMSYIKTIDPQYQLVDYNNKNWLEVAKAESQWRVSNVALRSIREALGLDLADARLVSELVKEGLL